jgi:hypothetical protein
VRALVLVVILGCSPPPQKPVSRPPPPPPDAALVVDAAPVVIVPDAPSGPLDRDLPRLAERSVALYAAVSDAFRTAGADCAAATKQLGTLRTEYAEVIAANAKVLHDGRSKELKAALVKHDDKLEASAKEIVGSQTIKACASDRAFTKAFDDLVAAPP